MERKAWLEDRRKGIGGSDAPAVCGVSPWRTPLQVYMEKTGQAVEQPETEAMRWGTALEPLVRQRYADETGRTVVVPGKILVHPDHSWMLASVDGIAGDRVLEVKTARLPVGWGEPGTDEIPDHYAAQVQHYLMVTRLEVADVAVLIGGSDFRIYEVPADREVQDMILDRERVFWEMVQARTPPDPVSFADVKARFGAASKAARIQATPEVLAALEALKAIKAQAKEEDDLKARIMKHLGEADTLVDGDRVLATWKAGKPAVRFSATAFKEAHPDLYESFCVAGEAGRRFLIK